LAYIFHKNCIILLSHSGWFEQMSHNPCKSTLLELDLSHSRMTSVIDINHLSCLSTLSSLKVNGCYRVNERGIRIIAEKFPQLTVLELSATKCTDLALHQISIHLTNLKRLNLSHCHTLTDAGLGDVGACLKQLEWLHLQDCRKITDQGLLHLLGLVHLRYCYLTDINVTEMTLEKLKTSLKECDIIYRKSQTT